MNKQEREYDSPEIEIEAIYFWEKEKAGHVSCLQTFTLIARWSRNSHFAWKSIADEYPTYFRPEFEYFIAGNISWTFVRLLLFLPLAPSIKSNMVMRMINISTAIASGRN